MRRPAERDLRSRSQPTGSTSTNARTSRRAVSSAGLSHRHDGPPACPSPGSMRRQLISSPRPALVRSMKARIDSPTVEKRFPPRSFCSSPDRRKHAASAHAAPPTRA